MHLAVIILTKTVGTAPHPSSEVQRTLCSKDYLKGGGSPRKITAYFCFGRCYQSYGLFKTSFSLYPAPYKSTPCVQLVFYFLFLLRWLRCLAACKEVVALILVSCLMAVTQVAPAHRGAELPRHWPLAKALLALNGSQQPPILWNWLFDNDYGNMGR